MLDRDLADLYNVTARRSREQVRRNIEKFPKHFLPPIHYTIFQTTKPLLAGIF
ncbi:ORF6N domain-containing protein [Sphingobacterium sp. LRF_L2]|uniref:ORF6N domain-containing protein n=1 Tax=Sphingobacterium sp. LRF_L2 TaxID=3369421 RepID=UPI003F625BFD